MAEYEEKETAATEESDKDILEDIREYVKDCVDEEDVERNKMKDDLRFCTLDQWPSDIRNDREGDIENGPRLLRMYAIHIQPSGIRHGRFRLRVKFYSGIPDKPALSECSMNANKKKLSQAL